MLKIYRRSGNYKENKDNRKGWNKDRWGKHYKLSSEKKSKSGDIDKEFCKEINRDNNVKKLNKKYLSKSYNQRFIVLPVT